MQQKLGFISFEAEIYKSWTLFRSYIGLATVL